MTETKCGFCKGTSFEFVPIEGVKAAKLYQCAKCGHPVGIAYESETVIRLLRLIEKKVHSLKP